MARAPHNLEISDDELVVGSLLGNIEAFDVLVSRYRSAVTSVAMQVVGSRAVAEEVAQESFLLAFRELPQLARIECFAGWLCAITRHRARRVAAREGRSEPQEPSALDLIVMANSPSLTIHPADEVVRQAEQSEIAKTLSKLPPEHQIVLRLRYYEEWSVTQIATFLSLPLTTVKWRLHHGRALMRRHLTPSFASSSEDEHNEDEQNHEQSRELPTKQSQSKQSQSKPHPGSAPVWSPTANHAVGPRSQPDRQPRPRRTKRRTAVQPHSPNG